tara:strand:+ start:7386 stop:7766 length:381 start_codon:yes stop_codon:yes gene_type:complete
MAIITLNFPFDLNISAQVGDTAYYVSTTTSAAFDVNSNAVIEIGPIVTVSPGVPSFLDVDTSPFPPFVICPPALYPNSGDFILFSKDNKANMNGMLGYYAEITMANDSKDKAELFRVNADYNESSK